jgi:hypothetical protein
VKVYDSQSSPQAKIINVGRITASNIKVDKKRIFIFNKKKKRKSPLAKQNFSAY